MKTHSSISQPRRSAPSNRFRGRRRRIKRFRPGDNASRLWLLLIALLLFVLLVLLPWRLMQASRFRLPAEHNAAPATQR